jgi:hypothetical protein
MRKRYPARVFLSRQKIIDHGRFLALVLVPVRLRGGVPELASLFANLCTFLPDFEGAISGQLSGISFEAVMFVLTADG